MKRVVSALLSFMMVFALASTAFAAGDAAGEAAAKTYTITINNSSDKHIYEAYQVFAGDLSTDGKTLSNIKWGSGISEAGKKALGAVDTHIKKLENSAAAATFAKDISKYLEATMAKKSVLEGSNHLIKDLEPGYYLVRDTFKDGTPADEDAYSAYVMQVVGDVTVKPKAGAPSVEKKVEDINDSTEANGTWQDSADHDIGDQVRFQLKATLGEYVTSYPTYKVIFHDTLSAGLDYVADSAVIKLNDQDVTANFTITSNDNHTVTFRCDDIIALGATDRSVITVEYTATLNKSAVVGAAGNTNKVKLEYSNNPNDNSSTGNTAEDTVKVFTYKLKIQKEDDQNKPLTGAGFTLYKKSQADGEYHQVGEEVGGKDKKISDFEWVGLDDGDYKLVETTTPDGFNTMEPILFTISAEHDKDAQEPALQQLNGGDKFTGEVNAGTLSGVIANYPGTKLPSTGGIGTTIFYVAGGILVVLSGALLLMKKNKNGNA